MYSKFGSRTDDWDSFWYWMHLKYFLYACNSIANHVAILMMEKVVKWENRRYSNNSQFRRAARRSDIQNNLFFLRIKLLFMWHHNVSKWQACDTSSHSGAMSASPPPLLTSTFDCMIHPNEGDKLFILDFPLERLDESEL